MITSREFILNLTKNMTPKFRYDFKEDYKAWKERAKEKLEDLLGLPLEKAKCDNFKAEAPEIKGDLTYIRFTFESEDGYEVPACLVKKTDHVGKVPLVICLQGHSTGMHISLGETKYPGDVIEGGRDFAVRAAHEGCVAIAIEQRYMGVSGFGGTDGRPACLHGNDDAGHANGTLLIGRCAIGERVFDVMRTIDVALINFADIIDENKIIGIGNSGGGTATFYAACIDERISIGVPSCAVCTFEDSIMGMYHCYCNYVPGIRKYFDMGDIAGLMAERKLVIVSGKIDRIFPINGAKESFEIAKGVFNHIGNGDNVYHVVGDGGHQFYPDEVWPIIHELLKKC
ncbi:MAG: hypothetical protein IJW50_04025 [Clostridia bacterium]|nr:hypothetical protein [Clostridia bacterium]